MTETPKTSGNECLLNTSECDLHSAKDALSPEALSFWKDIQTKGTIEDLEEARREIARALLNVNYKIAQRAIKKTAEIKGLELLETDEDLINKSIDLTTK